MFPSWINSPKKEPDHYFELKVSPEGMKLLEDIATDLAERGKCPKRAGERMKTLLLSARRYNEPLVDLPWGEVEKEAKRQGVGVTDILYDIMARKRGIR